MHVNAKQIWQTTIERLQTKVQPAVFTTWFQGTSAYSFQDGIFVVRVPTTFAKAHLEGRFVDLIRLILSEITGGPVEVQFVVAKEVAPNPGGNLPGDQLPSSNKRPYHLPKNRPAPLQRSSIFGEKEEQIVSPIAMNSIAPTTAHPPAHRRTDNGEQELGEAAGLNVLYVTSEKFTNEIINAIRFQKTEEFRTNYRRIDILLVDDIQFIAGKESTEEEFFHTFNTLYDANKQIIVTSDRPPKAIHSLQDRLRSRFEWGLLADVQAPEYEHRLAILRSKGESLHFAIPASVIEYVARPESSSVRELEGSLNRVIAYATLHDAPLSVSLAAKALEDLYTESKTLSTLTIPEVLEGVCRYYNVDPEVLQGKQRDRNIVWPRQVAMYVMREETNASLFQIGSALGGRDHTTIIHGCEKVHTEITNNDRIRREIAAVLETLQKR